MLESVTVCAGLVVVSACPANVSDVGATPAIGAVPKPLRATFSVGLTGSLVTMVREAVRAPLAVGRNCTLMVQLAPPVKLTGHPLDWMKSVGFAPVIPILMTVKDAPPRLERVTGWAVLVVVTSWAAKDSERGATTAPGWIPAPPR